GAPAVAVDGAVAGLRSAGPLLPADRPGQGSQGQGRAGGGQGLEGRDPAFGEQQADEGRGEDHVDSRLSPTGSMETARRRDGLATIAAAEADECAGCGDALDGRLPFFSRADPGDSLQ